MNPTTPKLDSANGALSIAAVERDTGLSKDTLRVWERRYGFPNPQRDAGGERIYSAEQLEKLRRMRRLMDQGRRPSQLVGLTVAQLQELLDAHTPCAHDSSRETTHETALLNLVRLQRSAELYSALQQLLLKQGLQRFVADTLAPLNETVGQAWLRGEIDVTGEHLYTEQVQNLLRGAIGASATAHGRPRVLLTTLPEELHGLGLLMVEATLVPEGVSCVSLGTQTPLADIRTAAAAGRFDVVGLSFSAAYPSRQAIEGILELKSGLPADIALWVGGSAVQGRTGKLPGVRVISDLADVLTALEQWRDSST
ncbi:MAG: MerR family transcriptional regulator [Rhodocyclaceae bacterium]|jgi:DNA-binding transcriptional MerR regulator/methylmalonyl-CoA mutase cobalamin-binding subunit|nr:MerR family transcriptional regulator [Rhodocyclaceae bacterium]MCL4758576.1 MerR family transcriptional regulator [Rhodocyclaceae bacterium]